MSDDRPRASETLGGDHRDLDRRFEEFQSIGADRVPERRRAFAAFASGLRRHIELEEADLFPVFQGSEPSHRELVERLLEEHRRIEAALRAIEEAIGLGRPTDEQDLALVDVLWEHNAREEGAVYPWFDTHLDAATVRRLAERLHGAGTE